MLDQHMCRFTYHFGYKQVLRFLDGLFEVPCIHNEQKAKPWNRAHFCDSVGIFEIFKYNRDSWRYE